MYTQADHRVSHHLARTSPIPTDPVYQDYTSCPPKSAPPERRSPIPKDPTYADASDYKIATPKPRVKAEALKIARNHQGRDLAYLFNPEFKVIPLGVKHSRRTPRNHEQENYRKIKEIQKANKEKQSESARSTPVRALYKPDKYEHVQSKVAQQIQTPLPPRTPSSPKLQRSKSASEIDKSKSNSNNTDKKSENSKTDTDKVNDLSIVGKRPSSAINRNHKENEGATQKRPPRPSSACEVGRRKKQPLSHIALNKQAIQKTKVKKNPSQAALQELQAKKDEDIKKHKRGNVPKYLRNRQNEWKKAEEERIANLPDPTVPPGHTVMTEEERISTLNLLQQSRKDMIAELQSIPLSRDTLRIKERKDTLERKLTEVDSALKIFTRPRVFIKDE